MRHALKLLAMAVVVSVAGGALAASAHATEPIQILREPALTHCTTATCSVPGAGEVTMRTHFFGVEAQEAVCHIDVDETTDEDGNGSVTSWSASNGSHGEANCATVMPPCTGSLPWGVTKEEILVNVVEMHITGCLDPSEFATCSGELDVLVQEEGAIGAAETQHYHIADGRIGTSFCEADIQWESNANPRVHTRHL